MRIPEIYLGEAILTMAFMKNHMPTYILHEKYTLKLMKLDRPYILKRFLAIFALFMFKEQPCQNRNHALSNVFSLVTLLS